MSWAAWTLASSVFLALYDLAKKGSVRGNAVVPVLLIATICGSAAYTAGLMVAGRLAPAVFAGREAILLAMVKSVIVAVSWLFTFTALRTLPITIATPIRASSPALVFVMALFLYGEVPTWIQGTGMLLVFAGYFAFSWAGRAEGIDFLRNRAVWYAVAGAVCSAVSSIFDKYVFQIADVSTEGVQFYFQIGLVAVYAVALAIVRLLSVCGIECERKAFQWRWIIPLVGILLSSADWLYFHGIDISDAPISAVALLRRFSVVITFVFGAVIFHEHNLRRKALALVAVLAGVSLIALGR